MAAVAAAAEAPLSFPHHAQLGGQFPDLLRPLTWAPDSGSGDYLL